MHAVREGMSFKADQFVVHRYLHTHCKGEQCVLDCFLTVVIGSWNGKWLVLEH